MDIISPHTFPGPAAAVADITFDQNTAAPAIFCPACMYTDTFFRDQVSVKPNSYT
jgi:hypothetical protein